MCLKWHFDHCCAYLEVYKRYMSESNGYNLESKKEDS